MTQEEIKRLWEVMACGWAQGDAAVFASVFAEDVSFVTVRGEEHHSRAAVEQSHARLFTTVYQGTALSAEIRFIRELPAGLWLVHVRSTVHPAGITTHAQAVVADGLITAFHNMIPAAGGPTR
jgi:uncharacterized protein (TIGR02246 family)